LMLGITLAFAPLIAFVVGRVWHEVLGVSSAAVLIVVAMVYITIARGALLGSCVMIGKEQFPEVFAVVGRCAAALDLSMPMIFLRDDIRVPVVALGFGSPYSLVISTHWLEHFKEDELAFMIGRELGHIKASHTRFTSILSVNGRENPIIALIFGAWLRRTEYTADRIGLLCCGSTDTAYRAIAMCEFHNFARKVDLQPFARQRVDIARDPILRAGEWLGSSPYATNRMEALRQFHHSVLFAYWEERALEQPQSIAGNAPAHVGPGVVPKVVTATIGRRIAAICIDIALVAALSAVLSSVVFGSGGEATSATHALGSAEIKQIKAAHLPPWLEDAAIAHGRSSTTTDPAKKGASRIAVTFGTMRDNWTTYVFLAYNLLLVAVVGQTFGMMIVSVRVTTTTFRRPSLAQIFWRYLIAVPLGFVSVFWPGFWRVPLYDRFSKTRVVGMEQAFRFSAERTTL
ncbi:MAG: RDD family protein, partial [Candidatus Eremiobacteraeota bacterium]|nr:RDD family protein [Candidatus Eremiobacteraeota bacterium]